MTKYPGLKKQYNLKSRADLLENDYVDKLSEEEKDWLNRFNEEFVGANFNHGGKRLHRTKKLKKSCYDSNNSRNRDVMSRAKASGELSELTDELELHELNPLEKIELIEMVKERKQNLADFNKPGNKRNANRTKTKKL